MEILSFKQQASESAFKASSAAMYARKLSRNAMDLSAISDARNVLTEEILLPPLKIPDERFSPARLSVCGFLPLPPILASPICTPTSSAGSQDTPDFQVTSEGEGEYTSLDSSNSVSLRVLVATPTWISTPPTPPTKLIRHSSASLSHKRVPIASVSPSASFPASMHPHANIRKEPALKKCISAPNMYERSRALSGPPRMGTDAAYSAMTFHSQARGRATGAELQQGEKAPVRSKAVFHLSNHNTDNEDDSDLPFDSRPRSLNEDNSLDGSWSDHSPEDIWEGEKNKDALRKFHALKELLTSEVGYLTDLKAFVTVYLRNLPTLGQRIPTFNSTFCRASSTFASGPWVNSYTQLQAAAALTSSSMTLTEYQGSQSSAAASSSIKDVPKSNIRYLFTDNELELLTRNAEEILQIHEHFVRELSDLLEPLGFTVQQADQPPTPAALDKLDQAIRAVSAKFASEASRFNAYQTFCAGHPEALDLVRKVSQQYPLEWEAYEQRCSILVAEVLEGGKVAESEPKPMTQDSTSAGGMAGEDRTRSLSLTSLDGAVRSLRLRCPSSTPVAPMEMKRETPARRIAFADYLIKPIQRICKYPLLFDQLLTAKSMRSMLFSESRSDVDVVVESCAQAMRHVASSVDEARHRQDAAMQSSLIQSRIFLGSQALAALNQPPVQVVTAEFLSSLGACLLAGSLDVMHHHPLRPLESISSFKAKYHGAFLYPGGYLIMVKVSKGRKYEPRHWFSLADFTISDVEEDEAMLPHSIRVSCGEQHFELATACQREKNVWLAAIQDSLKEKPIWINEPTPSFKFDDKGGLISSTNSESEIVTGLPTIQSIPEMSNNTSDAELSEPFFSSLRGNPKPKRRLGRYDMPVRPETSSPSNSSRRSSTTSVKGIFGPITSDAEVIVIRRSSPVARLQVDQALQDVISPSCLTARMYAFSRDEELFRSRSSLGRTRTKTRLSKHESIRVPRSRTSDSLDLMASRSFSQSSTLAARRNTKKLSINPVALRGEDGTPPRSASVTGASTPKSSQSSHVPSLARSDTPPSSSTSGMLTPPITASNEGSPRKSPRSLVRGVKDLFHFRPIPFPTSSSHSLSSTRMQDYASHHHQGSSVLHRWTMDSIRRRPRSVADTPDEQVSALDGVLAPQTMATAKTGTPLAAV